MVHNGATVGHGLLGAVPEMIIVKDLDQTSSGWIVYHKIFRTNAG